MTPEASDGPETRLELLTRISSIRFFSTFSSRVELILPVVGVLLEFLRDPEPGGEYMSGRGAIMMAECPKSKDIVLLIRGNSSLNGKAATEEFPEHLDFVVLDFHCFSLRFTTFVAVKPRFSRGCRVFLERYVFFL